MTIRINSHDRHITLQSTIKEEFGRFWVHVGNLDAQLRAEDDDNVYLSASDDFAWQDKTVSATIPFAVFWPEWRKFCEAMRARERAMKESNGVEVRNV